MPRGIEVRRTSRSVLGTVGCIACLGLLAGSLASAASAQDFVRPGDYDYLVACVTDQAPKPINVPDGIESIRVFVSGCICGLTAEEAKKSVSQAQLYTSLDDPQWYEYLFTFDFAPSEKSKQLTLYCYDKPTLSRIK